MIKYAYKSLAVLLGSWTLLISLAACSPQKTITNDPKEVGSLLVENLLSRAGFMMYDTPDVYALHYAEACAGFGALDFAGLVDDSVMISRLVQRYAKTDTTHIRNTINHVDANVVGILPLEMFLQTVDSTFYHQGIYLADGQWSDTLDNGLTYQTRYWIDDIYMISALQVQAFRATNMPVYLDRAATTVATYVKKLQQANGLFYHGPEAPFYWGRGNGWVAAGLALLLSELPESNPHYVLLLHSYKAMMKTLLSYQGENGMWHQLIDKPDSFEESSSTAMFGFAMAVGVKEGLLDETYTRSYVNAWNALCKYLDSRGNIREVCVGTGQSLDPEYYRQRPRVAGDLHGQAPMLWFASTLMQ